MILDFINDTESIDYKALIEVMYSEKTPTDEEMGNIFSIYKKYTEGCNPEFVLLSLIVDMYPTFNDIKYLTNYPSLNIKDEDIDELSFVFSAIALNSFFQDANDKDIKAIAGNDILGKNIDFDSYMGREAYTTIYNNTIEHAVQCIDKDISNLIKIIICRVALNITMLNISKTNATHTKKMANFILSNSDSDIRDASMIIIGLRRYV